MKKIFRDCNGCGVKNSLVLKAKTELTFYCVACGRSFSKATIARVDEEYYREILRDILDYYFSHFSTINFIFYFATTLTNQWYPRLLSRREIYFFLNVFTTRFYHLKENTAELLYNDIFETDTGKEKL